MRNFVATLLLLSFGVFGIIEVARRPAVRVPRIVDSGSIAWVHWEFREERSLEDQAYAYGLIPFTWENLAELKGELMERAREVHERFRLHFAEVPCRGAVVSIDANKITAIVDTDANVDSAWDFLARHGPVQYHCRVTAVHGRRIVGTVRFVAVASDGPSAGNGVLLLQPLFRRRLPDSRIELGTQLLLATLWGSIGYSRERWDPPPRAWEARITNVSGRGEHVTVTIPKGGHDRMAVGEEVRLSRGSSFVGFATITSVDWESSQAKFDSQFPGKGAPPRKGDRVYVR